MVTCSDPGRFASLFEPVIFSMRGISTNSLKRTVNAVGISHEFCNVLKPKIHLRRSSIWLHELLQCADGRVIYFSDYLQGPKHRAPGGSESTEKPGPGPGQQQTVATTHLPM